MSNGINNPTLLDLMHVLRPDGSVETDIVALLEKRLPMLRHAVAKEGNETTGHTFTAETSLPAVGWTRINEGVEASKGTDEQFTETCAMLEAYSKIDAKLVDLNGGQAYRATQDEKFMRALRIEAARALMYSSTLVTPLQPHGFTPRFNSVTGYTGNQVVKLNAAPYSISAANGDYASIWFIAWGDNRCYLTFPKGTMGGIQAEDKGEQLIEDSAGKINSWWMYHWIWKLGLVIEDHRQVARLANIDLSEVAATDANLKVLIDAMIDTMYRIFDETDSRIKIYTNRSLQAILHKAAMRNATNTLTLDTFEGRTITRFMGHEIAVMDTLTTAESLVP